MLARTNSNAYISFSPRCERPPRGKARATPQKQLLHQATHDAEAAAAAGAATRSSQFHFQVMATGGSMLMQQLLHVLAA
jgi:hypothetical protein